MSFIVTGLLNLEAYGLRLGFIFETSYSAVMLAIFIGFASRAVAF